MRLISLNAWGGTLRRPLLDFVAKHAASTDIFCFQEIYLSGTPRPDVPWQTADLGIELENPLKDFSMFARLADEEGGATETRSERDIRTGEVIFVRRSLEVAGSGGFHTYSEDHESEREKIESVTGNFQFVKIQTSKGPYYIGNVHGIWLPGSKRDTPKRVEQSRRLENFLQDSRGKKILCGDFNLEPDTESIHLLESGMRDLIKEYKVQTTRDHYYKDMKKYSDYIADYVFVSDDVHILDFRILPDEVSDHLPLILEFE